jgi:hypothetical protein
MFLVSIFCEIVNNGPYILKNGQKNLINFSVIQNGPFHKRMIIRDPTVTPSNFISLINFVKAINIYIL